MYKNNVFTNIKIKNKCKSVKETPVCPLLYIHVDRSNKTRCGQQEKRGYVANKSLKWTPDNTAHAIWIINILGQRVDKAQVLCKISLYYIWKISQKF